MKKFIIVKIKEHRCLECYHSFLNYDNIITCSEYFESTNFSFCKNYICKNSCKIKNRPPINCPNRNCEKYINKEN